jgi:hypothetical protein
MTKAKTTEKTPDKTPEPDLAWLRALWTNIDQVLSTAVIFEVLRRTLASTRDI